MRFIFLAALLCLCAAAAIALADPPQKTLHHNHHHRMTLFEKYQKRRECASNPAQCDVEFFDLDVRKTVKQRLNPDLNMTDEFCIGGCAVDSVLQWQLQWQ